MKNLLYLVCTIALLYSCDSPAPTGDIDQAHQDTRETHTSGPGMNAYFGDLHVHTSWSFDAFIYNTRTTPDDAYRYGRGEPINDFMGEKIKIKRPLDFMAVTDHLSLIHI